MRAALPASLSLLLLAGCAGAGSGERSARPAEPTARAEIVDAAGAAVGRAEFSRSPRGGVVMRVRAAGLQPGEHGVHIHQNGVCEGPGFTSAGPHLERMGRDDPHGLRSRGGGEAGDLPNLVVGADGTAQTTLVNASVAVAAVGQTPGVIGRAIVIHAKPDDQITQPIGGSGDRIACGVIRAAG